MMTTQDAIRLLREGGELPELAEAIGILVSEPTTSFEAIMLGLKHKGFVAEQAALALYERTFRPIPIDRRLLVTNPDQWARWVNELASGERSDSLAAFVAVERRARIWRLLVSISGFALAGATFFYSLYLGDAPAWVLRAVVLALGITLGIVSLQHFPKMQNRRPKGHSGEWTGE